MTDELRATDAADPPVDALTAGGKVRIIGAVWADDTKRLEDTILDAENLRRLYGDAAEGAGDL
ncbi:hypothetical protein [Dietzia kunjamensis]|uniref:hypothetical protein n=1 Tax=Dietzia kunjamensis TaxID=322509 RepID=UPI00388FC13D